MQHNLVSEASIQSGNARSVPSSKQTRMGWVRAAALATSIVGMMSPIVARAERSYEAWRTEPDASGQTFYGGLSVAMDGAGNVFATGPSATAGGPVEFYTVKYDGSTGAVLWEKRYNSGFGDSYPKAIAVDGDGNVIVTGWSVGNGSSQDFFTIKYNGVNGQETWSRRYNNVLANDRDEAVALGLDAAGAVYVTGFSTGFAGAKLDYFTIKYNANGSPGWSKRFNSDGNFDDVPNAIAVSASGSVAVTGKSQAGSGECIQTVKYDAEGAQVWQKIYDGAAGGDDFGRDVVMDADGNVVVSGNEALADNTAAFYTIKYAAADGGKLWDRTVPSGTPDVVAEIGGLGLDAEGDVIMTGVSRADADNINMYTAKYDGLDGAVLWERRTSAPERLAGTPDKSVDAPFALAIDAGGNAVIAGASNVNGGQSEYYMVKYDGADGATLFERRVDTTGVGKFSIARSVAVDRVGNFAVTGNAARPASSDGARMPMMKFNRFLLSPGDRVRGGDFSESATISGFEVPALSDTGELIAKVTVKDGTAMRSAIVQQSPVGGNQVLAHQGQSIDGLNGASFVSFGEPVINRKGKIAFTAKLAGVPSTQAASLWTTLFNDTPALLLRAGQQVPGLDAGVTLKGIQSVRVTEFAVNALVTLGGVGANAGNATALIRFKSPSESVTLLRAGNNLTVDGRTSAIRKITVATPGPKSPGHGRYKTESFTVANVTLADGRVVVVTVSPSGGLTSALVSGGDASAVSAGARWAGFGLPVASTKTPYSAVIANLKRSGEVTAVNDSAVLTGFNGSGYGKLIRENEVAPGANDATFAGFQDVVANDIGRYAYLATLRGAGVTAANRDGIWVALNGTSALKVRTGSPATDVFGEPSTAVFTAFTNFALPSGFASGPLFTAKVKGPGVSAKNNEGLWYCGSMWNTRQLLRKGDNLDGRIVKKFVTLNSVAGAQSVTRTFTNDAVIAKVVFNDKTQVIVRLPLH